MSASSASRIMMGCRATCRTNSPGQPIKMCKPEARGIVLSSFFHAGRSPGLSLMSADLSEKRFIMIMIASGSNSAPFKLGNKLFAGERALSIIESWPGVE